MEVQLIMRETDETIFMILTLLHMGDFEQLHTWGEGGTLYPPYFFSMFY